MDQAARVNDPERWDEFSPLDPELVEMLENGVQRRLPGIGSSASALAQTRAAWHQALRDDTDKLLAAASGDVTEAELFIPVQDGHKVRALLYRCHNSPEQENENKPLVIMIHGGGFCIGSPEMESAACIRTVQACRCVAVSLDYRLAPESKFPTAYEDCWDAIRWVKQQPFSLPDVLTGLHSNNCLQVIDNASALQVDLSQGFVLGGSSAGGHITIPLIHRARDIGLYPPITGVYLSAFPTLVPQAMTDKYQDLYKSRESLGRNANGSLSSKSIAFFDQVVSPDITSPLWNPLLWPTGHADLPPHFFQICGSDILRDEALIYERELRLDNQIQTRVIVYPGMPHIFWYSYPTHSLSSKFAENCTEGLKWLLDGRR
ncbi:alpha/beta hydrolase fold-domain-containing protein [Talaromyces proteolyticus]|uniref:Alpha/beta hydrolase fold-domain-containing protein n=1 Tax=Talaromyces proteolyticus TaxID=1131652 RepID=A0AAD4KYN7_9EURO|nr:alpha/beta hydrolase fold-domain-containing protein [Talaromyces proteolyticus]KAH8703028.1 alpha/beta hydrolase fold-domain-containing protein [Talaromyces proteolyticus]